MSEEKLIKNCRYCLSEEDENDMTSPCKCKGTNKYVHKKCLINWFKTKNKQFIIPGLFKQYTFFCELCNTMYEFEYIEQPKKIVYLGVFFMVLLITLGLLISYISIGYFVNYFNIELVCFLDFKQSVFVNGFLITHILILLYYLFMGIIFGYNTNNDFCLCFCSDINIGCLFIFLIVVCILSVFILYYDIITKIIKRNSNEFTKIINILPYDK